jgi:hypothetical protein
MRFFAELRMAVAGIRWVVGQPITDHIRVMFNKIIYNVCLFYPIVSRFTHGEFEAFIKS